MQNEVEKAISLVTELDNWLNVTFNDFYSVWSPNDCDQHIIAYNEEARIDQLIKFLRETYGNLGEITGFNGTENIFYLYLDHGKTVIEIEPFDNNIHHIDLI